MTVKQIADRVATYAGQTRAALVDATGGDLVIAAMSNAQKSIQQMHDFNYCQGQAWVSIDPTNGGALSSAKLVTNDSNTSVACSVQRVDTCYVTDTSSTPASYWPLLMRQKKTIAIGVTEVAYRYRGYPPSYLPGTFPNLPMIYNPDDPRNTYALRPPTIYTQNNILYLDPKPTTATTIRMDALLWMRPYLQNTTLLVATSSTASASVTLVATAPSDLVVGSYLLGRDVTVVSGTSVTLSGNANATIAGSTSVPYSNMGSATFVTNESYTDWFVDVAAEYLQWAAIVEVNLFTNQFVARQEGYNAPPEKARDNAAQKLFEWDNYLVLGEQPFLVR